MAKGLCARGLAEGQARGSRSRLPPAGRVGSAGGPGLSPASTWPLRTSLQHRRKSGCPALTLPQRRLASAPEGRGGRLGSHLEEATSRLWGASQGPVG